VSADDRLDQDHWTPDIAHLLVEHGALIAELRARRAHPTVDQHARAAALTAAASWLAGIDPYPDGIPFVLDVADTFTHWILTGTRP